MQQLIRPVHQQMAKDPAAIQSAPASVPRKGNREIFPVNNNQLVENRIAGLLDPNSLLMRKAQANGKTFAAGRGLQNSTLASEAVTSAMITAATPIAQQDANTFKEHSLLGRQQEFTGGENQLNRQQQTALQDSQQQFTGGENLLNRQQQTSLQDSEQQFTGGENLLNREQQTALQDSQQTFQSGESQLTRQQQTALQDDSQGFRGDENLLNREQQTALQDSSQGFRGDENLLNRQQQTALQDDSQGFQGGENLLNRTQQTEIENLRNQNQLGQLDRQSQLRLTELESAASIAETRDRLLSGFQDERLREQLGSQAGRLQMEIDSRLALQGNQLDQNDRLAYANATSSAINNTIAQFGLIYQSDSTPAQQRTAIGVVNDNLTDYISQLNIIYNITAEETGGGEGGEGDGTSANDGTTTDFDDDNDDRISDFLDRR